MSFSELAGRTAVVTGASRGFGRAIATRLTNEGVNVIGVARNTAQLQRLRDELGARFTYVSGDVRDALLAQRLILQHHPDILVLNAGATPVTAPLHEQTWGSFSHNWEVDTQHVFNWTRESLRAPLASGSIVIALSSGAAIGGSPLSGGYSAAKSAIRFISAYAAHESERAGLGIRFSALLPQLTPTTELGAAGAAAYAEREGVDVETFLKRFGPLVTPEIVGEAVAELCRADQGENDMAALAYLLTGAGLQGIA